MIPEEVVQQVLAATDIVEVVGNAVKLRRAGTQWRGLCPFHHEKSPSFYVTPGRNTYHCFGCGVGGSVFRFLMELENLSFPEAVMRLGEKAGIAVREIEDDPEVKRAAKLRSQILELQGKLSLWWHRLLMKHPAAQHAREYLKSRAFDAPIAKKWQLGYAPDQTNVLLDWAEKEKFDRRLLVEAGVLILNERGQPYARFQDRLMFPILNDYGEVTGFSGRSLDPEAKTAKYLNSPETRVFQKGQVFFGFYQTKRAVIKARRAIICEGQLDLIRAVESGIPNMVAPLGTAFTPQHAALLKRHAEEVVLCFDADLAGAKAAERAFEILAPTGIAVRVAGLPPGEDPDSLIRKRGVESFQSILDQAKDFFEFQIEYLSQGMNLSEGRDRLRFARELAGTIQKIGDKLSQDAAILNVASRLGISSDQFREEVRKAKPPTQETRHSQAPKRAQDETRSENSFRIPKTQSTRLLLRLVLTQKEAREWFRSAPRNAILSDLPGTEWLSEIWNPDLNFDTPQHLTAWLSNLSPEEERGVTSIIESNVPVTDPVAEAQDAWKSLCIDRLKLLSESVETRLKKGGLPHEEILQLQRKAMRYQVEIRDLRQN